MKQMNDKFINDSFSQWALMNKNTLFYQYRVERIHQNQKHLYADLFNQYRIFRCETSYGELAYNSISARLLNSEPVIFIVLTNYAESIAVGFIQLYLKYSSINAIKTTIVNDLFVMPDYRNNGIALKLIEAAFKFAINNESAIIQLETLQDNLIAKKLYESVGFKRQTSKSELNFYSIKLKTD